MSVTVTGPRAPGTAGVVEVAVVGAGAAGIGAAHRLKAAGREVVVLEARDRAGGRALTLTGRSGAAIDLGCGWLHSADQNPWVGIAEELGFTIDQSEPAWLRPAMDVNFPEAGQRAYRAAFEALEERLEKAALEGPDRPASELFTPEDARWVPLFHAFSGYYNGAPFDEVSLKDYAAYQPTEENWRVREGFGRAIAAHAEGLPILFGWPVRVIDRSGAPLKLSGPAGELTADTVIVTVPTGVLAAESLRFEPALPDKLEAADALPLGHVDKAFLKIAEPEALPVERRLVGRTDTADTASYNLRPLGFPVIEAFFGGDLAAALEQEAEGAFGAFAIDQIVAALGSDMRRILSPIAETRWGVDPFTLGAYSRARVGMAHMRRVLAEPVEDRIFFAGEACSPHAFSTAHGAYETGVAAAEAALAAVSRTE